MNMFQSSNFTPRTQSPDCILGKRNYDQYYSGGSLNSRILDIESKNDFHSIPDGLHVVKKPKYTECTTSDRRKTNSATNLSIKCNESEEVMSQTFAGSEQSQNEAIFNIQKVFHDREQVPDEEIKKEENEPKQPVSKATEHVKKIIRLFRKEYIKDKSIYNIKRVEEYFTGERFNFSKQEYLSKLAIFEELTCSKRGAKTTFGDEEIGKQQKIMFNVFNQRPK